MGATTQLVLSFLLQSRSSRSRTRTTREAAQRPRRGGEDHRETRQQFALPLRAQPHHHVALLLLPLRRAVRTQVADSPLPMSSPHVPADPPQRPALAGTCGLGTLGVFQSNQGQGGPAMAKRTVDESYWKRKREEARRELDGTMAKFRRWSWRVRRPIRRLRRCWTTGCGRQSWSRRGGVWGRRAGRTTRRPDAAVAVREVGGGNGAGHRAGADGAGADGAAGAPGSAARRLVRRLPERPARRLRASVSDH